jgi:hypothetical protein
MSNVPLLALHGVWNLQPDRTPQEAAHQLALKWGPRLAAGYRAAGLSDVIPPRVAAAYYAHLLDSMAQGNDGSIAHIAPDMQKQIWQWLLALGVPSDDRQGPLTVPIRQGLDWLARRHGSSASMLARIMTAVLGEVYVYLTRPGVRVRVREVVSAALYDHRPRVIVAHSLGSVVAYETLHATRAQLDLPSARSTFTPWPGISRAVSQRPPLRRMQMKILEPKKPVNPIHR